MRSQSRPEEIVNSFSHAFGCALALVSVPFLIEPIARRGNAYAVVGAVVFAVTMVLLYFTSALYHALPESRAKQICAKLDHSAIYLFIAGSYTAFALAAISGTKGWLLFGVIWGVASIGVTLKILGRLVYPLPSTGLYLAMGWLVVAAASFQFAHMTSSTLHWLVAGGLAYTAGIVFFLTDARLRFGHFIWHLIVMAGTGCHFVAIMRYSI